MDAAAGRPLDAAPRRRHHRRVLFSRLLVGTPAAVVRGTVWRQALPFSRLCRAHAWGYRLPTAEAAFSLCLARMDEDVQRAADKLAAMSVADSISQMERGVHSLSVAAKRAVMATIRAGESTHMVTATSRAWPPVPAWRG